MCADYEQDQLCSHQNSIAYLYERVSELAGVSPVGFQQTLRSPAAGQSTSLAETSCIFCLCESGSGRSVVVAAVVMEVVAMLRSH